MGFMERTDFAMKTHPTPQPPPEETDNDVPDLVAVDVSATVLVECHEDPVKLVLPRVQHSHVLSLRYRNDGR